MPQRIDSDPGRVAAKGSKTKSRRAERIDRAVRALSQGRDREANFRLLYEAYCRPLRGFFGRQGFSPEECFDLTQETFFSIYKSMETYRHEGRFEGWLFRLAKTTYLKRWRAASTAKRSGQEVDPEEIGDAAAAVASPAGQLDSVLHEERRQAMRRAVGELPRKMRKCMTLHLYHELTYREIAVILKIEVNTVKAHMFQGRNKLLEQLGTDVLGERDDLGRITR